MVNMTKTAIEINMRDLSGATTIDNRNQRNTKKPSPKSQFNILEIPSSFSLNTLVLIKVPRISKKRKRPKKYESVMKFRGWK